MITFLRILFFSLILLSHFGQQSFAQRKDTLVSESLDQVIITANKIIQKEREISKSIRVIDSETIENSNYSQVSELLSEELGLFVLGSGQSAGSVQSLSLRGSNPNHTLILVDGIRISDPSNIANNFDLTELSLANVERIEIIRGSSGTLYGSSAIGGVINIITKNVSRKTTVGKLNLRAGFIGENASELNESYFFSFNKNGFYTNFHAINVNVKGFDAVIDTLSQSDYNKDKDDFEKNDLVIKTGFKKNRIDAFLSYKNTQQKTDLDAGAFSNDDNSFSTLRRHLFNYQFKYQIGRYWEAKFIGINTNAIRRYKNDSSLIDIKDGREIYRHAWVPKSHYLSNLNSNEISLLYTTDKLSFLIGETHLNETMRSQEGAKYNVFTNSAFLHTNINLGILSETLNKLNFTAGLRGNYHKEFGSHINYEINPSYRINKNNLLYLSHATGFNAPSLFQLYDSTYGNAHLNPEISESYELGFKHYSTLINFQLSFYQTNTRDLIAFSNANNSYFNINEQKYNGIELSVTNNLSEYLSLKTNVNLVNALSSELLRKANSANIKLDYIANEKLSFDLSLAYIGERKDVTFSGTASEIIKLEAYQLLGFAARYEINEHLNTSFRITNLLDEKYQEVLGYNTRGRSFFLNLQYSL